MKSVHSNIHQDDYINNYKEKTNHKIVSNFSPEKRNYKNSYTLNHHRRSSEKLSTNWRHQDFDRNLKPSFSRTIPQLKERNTALYQQTITTAKRRTASSNQYYEASSYRLKTVKSDRKDYSVFISHIDLDENIDTVQEHILSAFGNRTEVNLIWGSI